MDYQNLQHLQRRFRDFRIELGVVATFYHKFTRFS